MLKATIRMMIISRQQIRHWREVKWNGFNVERRQREEKAKRTRHMTNFKLVVRNRLVSIFIAWYELMSCCDSRWMVTRTGDAMSVDSPSRNIQLCAICWCCSGFSVTSTSVAVKNFRRAIDDGRGCWRLHASRWCQRNCSNNWNVSPFREITERTHDDGDP